MRNAFLVNARVEEQLVGRRLPPTWVNGAKVNVEQAVLVDVHHAHARTPMRCFYARRLGDVFKPQRAAVFGRLVEVQFRRNLVATKKHVLPTIVVKIAHAHAAAVVGVLKLNGVD